MSGAPAACQGAGVGGLALEDPPRRTAAMGLSRKSMARRVSMCFLRSSASSGQSSHNSSGGRTGPAPGAPSSTTGARPVDFPVNRPSSASCPGSATARVDPGRGFARLREPQESCETPLTVKGVPGLPRSIFGPSGSRRVHWSALANRPWVLIDRRVHPAQRRARSVGDRGHEDLLGTIGFSHRRGREGTRSAGPAGRDARGLQRNRTWERRKAAVVQDFVLGRWPFPGRRHDLATE